MIERGVRVLALAAVAVACAAIVWFLVALRRDLDDPYWLVQTWVDALVDAGAPAAPVDADDPLLAQRLIVITSSINERTVAHVIPRLHYLARTDPRAPIDLVVSTTGGWRDSAFAIIDTMRAIEPPVNTWAVGGCYSAGTLVVAGGTGTRVASPDALLMVHANLEQTDEPFAQERRELEREVRFWREHARLPADWRLDSGTSYYLTAEEALRYGIVDAVREPARR
ncbi:MAG TPA: ATP-dependent Clp protease proteolytic subunit [Candidatus Limnocylindria bacterium]|nr:ATP-dependent Clp protease proteolytic subunit [Candidatus Limnocylindria bacterium]